MKKKLSRIVRHIRKIAKVVLKRLLSLACASALLLSCLSVSVVQQPKRAKAIAIVDDFATLAEGLKIVFAFAASAGGASNSEILTDSQSAGITDFPSAKQYVHDSFSGDSNFCSIFSFNPTEMLKIESAIASSAIAGGRLISKSFLKKLWAQRDKIPPTSGSLALVDEIGSLVNLRVIQGGKNDDDDDDDENDTENDTENETEGDTSADYNTNGDPVGKTGIRTIFDPSFLSVAVGSASFSAIYALTKYLYADEAEKKFDNKESETPSAIDICDYSAEYWYGQKIDDSCIPFGKIYYSSNLYKRDESDMFLTFGFGFPDYREFDILLGSKIYPLLYTDDSGYVHWCIATNYTGNIPSNKQQFEVFEFTNYLGSTGYPCGFDNYSMYHGTGLTFEKFSNFISYDVINDYIKNYRISASDFRFDFENIIDVGTYENVQKFREYILSNDYTPNDLTKLMVDGWKTDPKKTWKSIEDKGETTKKALETDKTDKYKTKTDSDSSSSGSQSSPSSSESDKNKGVTWSSFTDGLCTVDGSSVPVSSLLGEQTEGSIVTYPTPEEFPEFIPSTNPEPEPAPKPSFVPAPEPGTDPGTNPNPGTNPKPGTETDPGSNPYPGTSPDPGTETDPGTNPNPGTNPGTETDPGTNPNPGTNPGTETDPGTNPNPGTNPGTETDPDSDSDADEQSKEKLDDIDPDDVKTPSLKKKFPFCVPFDLIDLVSAVGAEKKAPKWELPFKLNSKTAKGLKIDEKIVIDFSQYEMLAEICRWFFRIMFILGLVLLTRYIIKG